MLDHVKQTLARNRSDLGAYRDQMLRGKDPSQSPAPEDDNMMVLGDLTVNQQAPPPPPQKSGMGTLAKVALGAGLIGTGMGAGLGGALLLDAAKDIAAPAVQQQPATPQPEPQAEKPEPWLDFKIGKPE